MMVLGVLAVWALIPSWDIQWLLMMMVGAAVLLKLCLSESSLIVMLLLMEFLMSWVIFSMVSPGLMSEFSLPMLFLLFTLAVGEGSFGLSLLVSYFRAHNSACLTN